jgi:intracellular septation protein A
MPLKYSLLKGSFPVTMFLVKRESHLSDLLIISLAIPFTYAFVEYKYGVKSGIIVALGLASLLFFYFWYKIGSIDNLMIAEFALLLILGGVSLRLHDSKFFKYQPAILNGIGCIYLSYLEFTGEPILIRMLDVYMPKLAPEMIDQLNTPLNRLLMARMSWQLIPIFLLHGILIIYAARNWKSIWWATVRASIWVVMLVLPFFNMLFPPS